MLDNHSDSSLLKIIDYEEIQKQTEIINVKKLSDFVCDNNIHKIYLLCMDIQCYELNILHLFTFQSPVNL